MLMRKDFMLTLGLVLATASSLGWSDSDYATALPLNANGQVIVPDGARLLASQCFQCHGPEGNSVSRIEGLAEEAGAIASEMLEMKYSKKTNDIMHRQAKGYTESEIQAIAAYFASRYGTSGHDD